MSFTGSVFCIRNLILILRNSFLRFVCLAKPMASELQQANSSSVFLRSLLSCHSIALCPRFIFVTETCNSRNEFGIFLKSQLTFEFDFSAMYSLYFLNRVYSLYEVNFIQHSVHIMHVLTVCVRPVDGLVADFPLNASTFSFEQHFLRVISCLLTNRISPVLNRDD